MTGKEILQKYVSQLPIKIVNGEPEKEVSLEAVIDECIKENCKKCQKEAKKKYWRSKYPL